MSKRIVAVLVALTVSGASVITAFSPSATPVKAEPPIEETTSTITITYTSLGVPAVKSFFKTYMDYRTITNKLSPQYNFIQTFGWCDNNGFMRADGEKDLGITDDYYMIALGSYYGTEIGTKYKITTDTGNVFYGILCDQKDDAHTNPTHQYASNNDVVEFIVDTRKLIPIVKRMGSANVYMPLNGNIAKVERMDFVWNGGE